MKKIVVFVLMFSLIQGCGARYLEYSIDAKKINIFPPAQKMRVAVLPFSAPSAEVKGYSTILPGTFVIPENSGGAAADAVSSSLIGIPNVVIIERSQLEKILNEHQLSLSGVTINLDFNLLGQILPVDALVLGNVTSFQRWHDINGHGGIVAYSARLVDIHTGEILFTINCNAVKYHGMPENIINDLARDAIKKLLEK